MAVPTVINLDSSPSSTQPKHPPSSHRLATVSASEALLTLQESGSTFISTGLNSLDRTVSSPSDLDHGGLERGKVTEIWGPSGSGKTALALQATAKAIEAGGSAMWIEDAHQSMTLLCLNALIHNSAQSSESAQKWSNSFHRRIVPTLSHLLAMILHPTPNLFPPELTLLVVDGIDTLINLDYPRFQTTTTPIKPELQKWQSSRRYAMLGSVVSALDKLAVVHNIAVVVTTSCSTRSRAENGLGAALVPGVGGIEWDGGIWNRLAIFRDFGGRFVGVQKSQGKNLISRDGVGETGKLVCFGINADGSLEEFQTNRPSEEAIAANSKPRVNMAKPPKRSFDEIADSEDEDVDEYGWADSDEHALAVENLAGAENSVSTERGDEVA